MQHGRLIATQTLLFIDGENVPATQARAVMERAGPAATLRLARVYGDVTKIGAWTSTPGVQLVHVPPGRNATDIALCLDAMEWAMRVPAPARIVLVSNDGDFVPLALRLRELGHEVAGLGLAVSSKRLRPACSTFEVLPAAAETQASVPALDACESALVALIARAGSQGLALSAIGGTMGRAGHRVSALPEKTWRAYLEARGHIFICDPKGPQARVRLVAR